MNCSTRPLRSYGRRKAKPLSERKARLMEELLPALRVDVSRPYDKGVLFPGAVSDVWLEIGFGAGEHLLWQAEHHPEVGFIGCEPFINGMASLLGGIEDRGLGNIRVHDGDARDILAWLPEGALARVFVLFSDPWPKKRQMKRRLMSPEAIGALARVMAKGAELRFASDVEDYVEQALALCADSGVFILTEKLSERPDDWPETRYERKAFSEGRAPAYLRFQRS